MLGHHNTAAALQGSFPVKDTTQSAVHMPRPAGRTVLLQICTGRHLQTCSVAIMRLRSCRISSIFASRSCRSAITFSCCSRLSCARSCIHKAQLAGIVDPFTITIPGDKLQARPIKISKRPQIERWQCSPQDGARGVQVAARTHPWAPAPACDPAAARALAAARTASY